MSWKERLEELLESGAIMTGLWITGVYIVAYLIIHFAGIQDPSNYTPLGRGISLIPFFIISAFFTILASYGLVERPMLAPEARVVGLPYFIFATASSVVYLIPISFLVWWQSLIAFAVYVIVVSLGVK